MQCVRQSDLTKAGTVRKGEFLDFLDVCVRDVHMLQNLQLSQACAPSIGNPELAPV